MVLKAVEKIIGMYYSLQNNKENEKMYNDILSLCKNLKTDNHIERISKIAEYVMSKTPGDLLEIGAGYGNTTIHLLKLSKKFNTKTIVIDPFESGWDYMAKGYGGYPYDVFVKTVEEYPNYLILYKENSQSPEIMSLLNKHKNIKFAFVDGAQEVKEVLYDLNNMKLLDIPVIAVDDMNRPTNVRDAVAKFLENKKYELIFLDNMRECYLIKK